MTPTLAIGSCTPTSLFETEGVVDPDWDTCIKPLGLVMVSN